jgi:phosphatidyl-myo-inositol dimannoside synthase
MTAAGGRPRLLVSTTDFPPDRGGIQSMVHELTHRLAPRWAITVIAPPSAGSNAYDAMAPFAVVRTHAAWDESRARVLLAMTRLTARVRADVLLAAHLNALPPLVIAGRGRPTVAVVHGSEVWAPRTRVLTRLMGRRVDRAMAVSRFTASEAAKAGVPGDRIVVTPLGATPPALAPADTGRAVLQRLGLMSGDRPVPFFLTVSRLAEPHKGHDVFLRALPDILARFPALRYVIAGTGPRAGELRALAAGLGIDAAIVMPGAVDEETKAALMGACRAFVMLSRESRSPALFEGFGIAYIEAAMAGRPSLAGASGGVPDAVVDGETGVLVDPMSESQVVRGAMRLLEDPAFADLLGQRAHERALRDFTWSAAVERMERCLEAVL